jgi:hypothetical protein
MSLKSSIITSPETGVTLEKEYDLIKSAFLFSDKITITSPGMTSILMLLKLASLTEKEKIEYLIHMTEADPSLKGHEYAKAIQLKNTLSKKKYKTREEIIQFGKLKHHLSNLDKHFEEWGNNLLMQSTMPQFIHLIENGIVEVNHVDVNETKTSMAKQVLDFTIEILNDHDCYPLFDRLTEDLASIFLQENKMEYPSLNMKESYIGKKLALSLPNLKSLTFEQITKLKGELDTEFNRFRGLILDYAQEIEGIPFNDENRSIIEKKLQYEVSPQLEELQESINRNSFLNNLLKELGENIGKYALFFGISSLTGLQTAIFGAGGLSLAEATFKALNKTRDEKVKARNNSLYFYHQISKY